MKKILSLALIINILSTLMGSFMTTAVAATSGTCGESLTWEFEDGILTISGTGEMLSYEDYPGAAAPWYPLSSSIETVNIQNGTTKIGNCAFFSCYNLTTIAIPSSVENIGQRIFQRCTKLTNINIDSNNKFYSVLDGVLFDKEQTKLVWYPLAKSGNYTIPNSVTSIDKYALFQCSNLSKIEMNEKLINIGEGAFRDCDSLTSITIPAEVTNIGAAAFSDCDRLTAINVDKNNKFYSSIDGVLYDKDKTTLMCFPATKGGNYIIPSSVTKISYMAFSCSNISNMEFSDKLRSIDGYAFNYCKNLTSAVIPKGIEVIEYGMFNGCSAITNIIISDSVSNIGNFAFNGCTNLTDVYYGGSEEEWKKITIGSGNSDLTNAKIHYNSYAPEIPVYKAPEPKSGEFNFASGKGMVEPAEYVYHDNYFEKSAYKYNHDLAKMSMRLALSAYNNIEGETDTTNGYFGNGYKNVEKLLTDMGFSGVTHNDWYEKVPTTSSIGIAMGKKHIAYPDGDYTVIAIAVRGGNYKVEWGGNFNVGADKLHAGFKEARDQVIEFAKQYVKDEKIGGNIKLWITGYSRAAATTNLAAAYLDENPDELGNMVTLSPENIYAYCFEAPMGVRNPDNESGLYNNIFSIVNQHDFVPMVAMRKWGYDRYGVTKYLPSAQTNSDYIKLRDGTATKDGMVDYYAKYRSSKYNVDDFEYHYLLSGLITDIKTGLHYGQGVFLDRTMDKLSDVIGSPENYTQNYQELFEYIGETILGEEITEPLKDSFIKEFEERKLILTYEAGGTVLSVYTFLGLQAISDTGAMYLTFRSLVKDAFANVGINLNSTVLNGLTELLIKVGPEDAYTLFKNGQRLKHSHYPELCMAWLDAIDEDDFSDKRLRTLYLNCPVDLEVYDSNDNLVAAVYGDLPQQIEGSAIVPYIDENGQKVVYLPTDEEYRVEVIATDDGEVTYSVQEQDVNTGSTKVINYNNMTVKKNDTLTGTAENLDTAETATYELKSDAVAIAEPEVIEAAQLLTITPVAEGNGNVSGGGSLYKGEYAQVTATPLENESFLGWYNGGTLVSSEATYRFQVSEEVTLTAKFSENTCEVVFLGSEDYVMSVQRIIKGGTVIQPDNTQRTGYVFDGYYTDSEYKTNWNPQATYTENSIVYAKYLSPSEWNNFDIENNEIIIYSPESISNVKIIVALYEGEKIVKIKAETADISAGKNTFDSLFTDYGTADKIKIMVWENKITGITPLFNVCKVNLD